MNDTVRSTNDTGRMTDAVRRSRTAFLWVGLIAPLVILGLAAAIVVAWLPELPDPVAIHWGPDGVNGFASQWGYIAMIIGIGGGLVVFDAALAMNAHRLPQSSAKPTVAPWSATARFMGAVNLGLSAMIAFIAVAGAALQRGLADAAGTGSIAGWAAIGFVILVVFAVLGWFMQPRSPRSAAQQGMPTESMPLADSERAAWFGTSAMGRPGVIVLVSAVLLLIATTVWVFAMDGAMGWILAAVTVLLVALIASTLVFRVRVNADGLRVRSIAGWPRWNIPASQIADARVVQVDPMGEFGGWGVRIAVDGRRGIVLRTGEGLQVTRRDGRVLVITIDDARTAAAVLAAAGNAATATDSGEIA